MATMKKVRPTANLKLVNAVVLYPNTSSVLCFDSDKTNKVPAATLKQLFENGVILISTSAGEFRPTIFEDKSTYYAVSYVTVSSSTATQTTYKSDTIA